jgi:hypothetical protein
MCCVKIVGIISVPGCNVTGSPCKVIRDNRQHVRLIVFFLNFVNGF